MSSAARSRWCVRRQSGLLPRGFSKRFDDKHGCGVTLLFGVPVGRFSVVPSTDGDGCELRYVRWPIVDVLSATPREHADGHVAGAGFLRAPLGRRVRFCSFDLVAPHLPD